MKTRHTDDGRLCFWCPGCQEMHGIPSERWHWNGDCEKPTLAPSVKITSGHYAEGWQADMECWCTYNKAHTDSPAPFKCSICHFHLEDGQLKYCADSTHGYAGQTIGLEDVGEKA